MDLIIFYFSFILFYFWVSFFIIILNLDESVIDIMPKSQSVMKV